jgi:CBS domain containing-hemolysin-like protein
VNEVQFYWLALLLILVLDLLIAAIRASLLNASQARLLSLENQEDKAVRRTVDLLNATPRLRASLTFALAMLRVLWVSLVFLVTTTDSPSLEAMQVVSTLLLAALALWVVEFIAEWFVLRDPETWALQLTPPAKLLVTIFSPILFIPLAIFRSEDIMLERSAVVTEDELKTLVEASQREGVLEQDEQEMIFSIFRFTDTLAREVMIPRIDVLALDIGTPLSAAVDALLESGFSRVPVFEGTIDNILGFLYGKDILRVWREGDLSAALSDLLRSAYFTPETKKVADLLEEMQDQRIHIAIVVDEYGGTAGLVTLEDIVEEIIGEVRDEYDQAEEILYQKVGEEEYVFHGRIDLDDFNIFMGSELPNDEADTLGGYIYSQIGRVPRGGESLLVDDVRLIVEQVIGRRIRRVRAQRGAQLLEIDEDKENDNG